MNRINRLHRHHRRFHRRHDFRLQRALFWWFGITILMTCLVSFGVMRLVSPDMHSWRRDADRLQAFAGGRFAKVWDDAPARLELTTAVSQAFDAAVRVEDVSGRRLDWFFREWFVENPLFDQSVDTVSAQARGDTSVVAVVYGNRARGVLPIHARFTFSDGTTQNFDYPAEVWSTNTSRYQRQYEFAGKRVTGIELDPDRRLPDIDRGNNTWGRVGGGAAKLP